MTVHPETDGTLLRFAVQNQYLRKYARIIKTRLRSTQKPHVLKKGCYRGIINKGAGRQKLTYIKIKKSSLKGDKEKVNKKYKQQLIWWQDISKTNQDKALMTFSIWRAPQEFDWLHVFSPYLPNQFCAWSTKHEKSFAFFCSQVQWQ